MPTLIYTILIYLPLVELSGEYASSTAHSSYQRHHNQHLQSDVSSCPLLAGFEEDYKATRPSWPLVGPV